MPPPSNRGGRGNGGAFGGSPSSSQGGAQGGGPSPVPGPTPTSGSGTGSLADQVNAAIADLTAKFIANVAVVNRLTQELALAQAARVVDRAKITRLEAEDQSLLVQLGAANAAFGGAPLGVPVEPEPLVVTMGDEVAHIRKREKQAIERENQAVERTQQAIEREQQAIEREKKAIERELQAIEYERLLVYEQQKHKMTREALERERTEHHKTRDALKRERDEHNATQGALEHERYEHSETRALLDSDRTLEGEEH